MQPAARREEIRSVEREEPVATQAEPTALPAAAPVPGEAAVAGAPVGRPVAPPPVMRSVRRTTVLAEPGYRAVQLVWLLLTVAEAFVALRVIFRAVSANPAAGFVRFVDTVAGVLVAPFHPIVADARLGGGGVLEIGSLVAMAVFLAAALVLVRLIRILTAPRPPAEPAPV
ncbi:MAG: hypothetical protein JWL78_1501 [Chloroflexi bacterium]|jgi:hypothetical protein|nr:hypothetical protein [Chloroflexota bacterium]MEA2615437.1 hypothetical protein [Chloroflexota bacterium]